MTEALTFTLLICVNRIHKDNLHTSCKRKMPEINLEFGKYIQEINTVYND